MKFHFGQEVLVLPGGALGACEKADAAQLRVLLWLASDLALAEKPRQLARLAGCTEKELRAALKLWREAGVLVEDGEAVMTSVVVDAAETAEEKPQKEKRTLVRRADVLPTYTTTELAELIERRQGMRELIDEAQQILGKMFHPGEINILVGMVDYLGMDEDCILLLLAHCKRIGKNNLRSIEKLAYSLVDEGVTESGALEERIHRMELLHTFEGEVRALFGMKSRALTSKEKKMLTAWCEFGYGIDVVRRAYDITVGAINEPSTAYADAILRRWSSEGLRTGDEIDTYLAKESAEKAGKTTLGNSFDTDDFFEAALRRSFETDQKS